ncbi:alcohol dehydrogenase AdhP [Streptomyces longisporus]|uniref:alcohol dehydrogenase n=1 Tax=Streptomyces longisporus TaxID=1948 RepID=A0ABP5Y6C1_STRLO
MGERVAVPWLGKACGRCEHCLSGWETLCEQQIDTGYGCDGGYAEKMPAWADFAQPVPEGVGADEPASLTCVSGIGGLALAVQDAKIAGATVAAADVSHEKLEPATELRVDLVIDARKQNVGQVLLRHGGAHAAIALNSGLRRGGKLVMVALPAHGTSRLSISDTVVNGTSVIGSIVGTRQDLDEAFRDPQLVDEVLRGHAEARIVFDLCTER